MRCLGYLLLSLVLLGCSSRKQVLLDTDLGPDYDDVGALALLHALADNGEAEILAVLSCNRNEATLPCVEIINRYYGRGNLPLGAPSEGAPLEKSWFSVNNWTKVLPERYPHTLRATSEASDAVSVYRRILAEAAPKSVTVISIGFFTNLAQLLDSPADSISMLTGEELVARKVKELVSMAGLFPEGKEYNIERDVAAAQRVLSSWPTPVLLSGFEIGEAIRTGKALAADSSLQGCPVRDAYALSLPQDDPRGRSSWDQTAVLVGVRGLRDYYTAERGILSVDSTGMNCWTATENGPHARLVVRKDPTEMAEIIERLMCQPPTKKP